MSMRKSQYLGACSDLKLVPAIGAGSSCNFVGNQLETMGPHTSLEERRMDLCYCTRGDVDFAACPHSAPYAW